MYWFILFIVLLGFAVKKILHKNMMGRENRENKDYLKNKLIELSTNGLYHYVFKDVKLEDHTEAGLKVLMKKCDDTTKAMRIKVGNYKKNRLYRDIMSSVDVNRINEAELEKVYLKLIKKSEAIRLKLKKDELKGPELEFKVSLS